MKLTIQIIRMVVAAGVVSASGAPAPAQCLYEWKPNGGVPGLNGAVFAATVYNSGAGPELIAGGAFTTAGGNSANRVARWNGSSWSSTGSVINSGFVSALTVYDGALIAGGPFTVSGGCSACYFITQWNGSSWSALGSGLNAGADALTVYNGALIAGGGFTTAGGNSVNRIARWNGSSWSTLGAGVDGVRISALTVYNGSLIAGGQFSTAGGSSANNIAQWNGSSWSALDSGVNLAVYALTVYNGNLIAGGRFQTAGSGSALHIAQWNGATWSALGSGLNQIAYALTVYNGNLIAGGNFTTAGGNSATYIAQWNGASWSALGSGMNSQVSALTVYDGALIAGGNFTTAGGYAAERWARWGPQDTTASPLYVDAGASGANDGTSWADALNDLQCALYTAAASGGAVQQIWVADGTYSPDGGYQPTGEARVAGSGVRGESFQLLNGVAIYGGFEGDETSLEQRNVDSNATILSGDLAGDDGPDFANNGENSYHVVTGSGTDATAILDGLTVKGGNAYASGGSGADHNGGGCNIVSGSPTIARCSFTGNTAYQFGGGLYAELSGATITNCRFTGNLAGRPIGGYGWGGGVYLWSSSLNVMLTNCVFSGNTATGLGGGLWNSTPVIISNCSFSGNAALGTGDDHSLAPGYGGGISTTGDPTLTNIIVWGNTAAQGDPQIQSYGGAVVTARYCDIQGGFPGVHNTNANPLFVDADGADNLVGTTDDDLRLSAGSPCINAGSNGAVPADTADLDGDSNTNGPTPFDLGGAARFFDICFDDPGDPGAPGLQRVDIGAYESSGHRAVAPILYVNAAASGAASGLSWPDALPTLQEALCTASAAGAGQVQEIRVAAGTYKPTVGTDRTKSFQLINGVALSGGFAGDETETGGRSSFSEIAGLKSEISNLRSQTANGPCSLSNTERSEGIGTLSSKLGIHHRQTRPIGVQTGSPPANETILSGDLLGDDIPNLGDGLACFSGAGVTLAAGCEAFDVEPVGGDGDVDCADLGICDNSHRVVLGSSTNATAVLDGFTVTAGNAPSSGGGLGLGGSATATIRNCIIRANHAMSFGGGCSSSGDVSIVDCLFEQNRAQERGGAWRIGGGAPLVQNCTFDRNVVNDTIGFLGFGGAIYSQQSSVAIEDCVFTDNTANNPGGALYLWEGSPTVSSCRFERNISAPSGGGVHLFLCDATITNCEFIENESNNSGAGIQATSGRPLIQLCLFERNVTGQGGAAIGTGVEQGDVEIAVLDCDFIENSATASYGDGGALQLRGPLSHTVQGCRFTRNTAGNDGGAIDIDSLFGAPTVFIANGVFQGNTAGNMGPGTSHGGAIRNAGALTCVNSVFVGNSARVDGSTGGAVSTSGGTFVNCTFTRNETRDDPDGGGAIAYGASTVVGANCIFWDNTAAGVLNHLRLPAPGPIVLTYSAIQDEDPDDGTIPYGGAANGNIDDDPIFVRNPDPGLDGNWDGVGDDYGDLRLADGSPGIDAGNNALVAADATDLDCDGNRIEPTPQDFNGAPRFVDDEVTTDCPWTGDPLDCGTPPIVDMGAYEHGPLVGSRIFVDAKSSAILAGGTSWADAYPSLTTPLSAVALLECGALEIWVAAGAYMPDGGRTPPGLPHVPGNGDRNATFQLVDGVVVYGGFPTPTLQLPDPAFSDRDPAANPTILSGDLLANDASLPPNGPPPASWNENAFHVVTGTGTGAIAILDGFTIRGGNADGGRNGGAIVSQAGGPTLRNCTVADNWGDCATALSAVGADVTVEALAVQGTGAGSGGVVSTALAQTGVDLQGLWSFADGELGIQGLTVSGPGSILLDSTATLSVRAGSPCGSDVILWSGGSVPPLTPIFLPATSSGDLLPARWEMSGAFAGTVSGSDSALKWRIGSGGLPTGDATLTWSGNYLDRDLSAGGVAEAAFTQHGALTITGSFYQDLGGGNLVLLHNGLLLTATVGPFQVRETAPNTLTFVEPPLLIPTGGYLVTNTDGLTLAGRQSMTLNMTDLTQDGGNLSSFATTSTITASLGGSILWGPTNPPSPVSTFRSDLRGTGFVDIEAGATLVLAGDAVLNLSGLADDVCVTSDLPGGSGLGGGVTVDGRLIVQDQARVHNTAVKVALGHVDDGQIVHNDIRLVEASTGFGGEFFASSNAVISCNTIISEGDRYLDLDPDPDDGLTPTLINNRFFVVIKQGLNLDRGELLELRSPDYDNVVSNGSSGAYELASSPGYSDIWALEELDILPGAKVNLTNRQGFDFNPGDPLPDALYVKDLVIGSNGVLNTGLQRLYYQSLTMDSGAVIVDIPVLGFSLKVIAMEEDAEFRVRVSRRETDPADIQPPFGSDPSLILEGTIERIDTNGVGVMDLRTKADNRQSASSVAAKGAFARAGEDEIVVAFDYLFVRNPAAELIVYLSDTPDISPSGCTTNGTCDNDCCEVARVYVPADGRDGKTAAFGGTGEFATFYGRFPRGNLNFHRGTYVELELRGADARVWIDDWDPRIRCSGCADLNGTGGPEGEDYLLLLASFGLDIDANMEVETGEQENADCFDSVLGGDRYVDTGDLLAWDTFLDEDALNACGTGVRGSRKSEVGSRKGGDSLVRESVLEPPGVGIPSLSVLGTQSSVLLIAGKPNGAGLQDDYLYPIYADGACPGGSAQPAASGAGTRGHGRLVTAPDGTLYQLHATGGVLPVAGGAAMVAPGTNLIPSSDSSLRVTVGVNDFGGGEFLGLPIADAAFHPTNANVLYVVPVLVIPLTGLPPCDRYKAAAKLVLSGGNYTVERLYEVPAANRTPPCAFPPQLDQGEFREIEVSTDGSKVFIASARADNDNDWLLVFNESSGALSNAALVGEVPPEGMMPAGLTVAAPLAMLASRTGGTPYLYLAAGVNAAPSETVGGQNVARTRVFRFDVTSGVAFAGALDISNPECVNPYDTLGCTSTLTALTENPDDGTLYALGFVSPRFNVDYPYNSPPFGGPNPNQIVIFTTPTLATVPPNATWSMSVPPAPPAAAQATADRVTCADLALPISLAWNAPGCGVAGDMDGDGDVQLDDWADLAGCLSGPAGSLGGGCGCADVDADEDADMADVAGFQNSFGP